MTEHTSWLQLERHALGELDPAEQAAVELHLSTCERCQGRRAQIQADARPMPPLRAAPRPWWLRAAPALALAATCLLALWVAARPEPEPGLRAKGDEVVLTLVRERDGRVVQDPSTFARSDRFRVLLTCPPGAEVLDIVVFQGDQTHHPLPGGPLDCGNRVSVPGAFRLSGTEPAQVCALDAEEAPVGCVSLEPEI